jgi:MFS family permease
MATKIEEKPLAEVQSFGRVSPSSGTAGSSPTKSDSNLQEMTNLNDELPPNSTDTPQEQVKMSKTQEVLFVAVIVLSHFMTQAAFAEALAPIMIIITSFPGKPDPRQNAWGVAAYALTSGTFILISGRLGDIMGHHRIFSLGYAWFLVWSALVGLSCYAHSQIFFDFCRAMQGIGPALLIPNGVAMLARAYPPGLKKNLLFSLFGCMAPIGFVTGTAFSSLFAQLVWWPWAFWSFSFGCLVLFITSLLVVPKPLLAKPEDPPTFDWKGSLTGVMALVLVNIATTNAPIYGWSTPHVYFLLIIGVLFAIGFGFIESRARDPLLPVRDLNSTVAYMLACVALGWGCFGIWLFYVFRFLGQMRHETPLTIAAQFAPAPISGIIASGFTGFLLTHTPVSLVNLLSMVAFFTGCTIAGTMPVQQNYWAQMFIAIIVMPFGMDMSFPAATIVLSNHMPIKHQGLAASLVVTVVNYSISLALGVAGTVERRVLDRAVKSHEQYAVLRSVKSGFYSGMCMAALGILLATFYFIKSLRKEGWKTVDD